ncbi:MAG: ParB/RepB/Spo0J family partition protein [Cyanobacteria bacterium RU_5_0]|nr:ParB/RepB/Spo0J family partition protein [Cyanobacteria bacterium RU_5_0]
MGKFNKLLTSLQDEELEPQSRNDTKLQEAPSQGRQLIPRDRIVRDENQVRKYFDVDKLNGLAQTIAEEGILEDLAVYEIPGRPGYYQLVFGERRYRASGIAGLDKVPVRVIEKPDEKKLLKLQLIENKHHEDLNPVEEVEGALSLLAAELEKPVEAVIALLKQMDNDVRRASYNVIGQPESDVVIKLLEGLNIKWRSFVLNQLPLLGLSPDVLEPIRQGKIEYTKALAISRLKDEEQRQEVLQEAIAQNLSIRDIRDRIKQISQPQEPAPQPEDFVKRFSAVNRQLKKTKIWEDQQKRDRLETLLKEIETLVQ